MSRALPPQQVLLVALLLVSSSCTSPQPPCGACPGGSGGGTGGQSGGSGGGLAGGAGGGTGGGSADAGAQLPECLLALLRRCPLAAPCGIGAGRLCFDSGLHVELGGTSCTTLGVDGGTRLDVTRYADGGICHTLERYQWQSQACEVTYFNWRDAAGAQVVSGTFAAYLAGPTLWVDCTDGGPGLRDNRPATNSPPELLRPYLPDVIGAACTSDAGCP
jgi:hypothetical protein